MLPTRLDPQRSSQVCGQCHSVWEFRDAAGERQANARGFPYRPGDELRDTRFLPQPTEQRRSPELAAFVARDPAFVTGSFWPDGMIRVSGREYNGLIDSPCFKNGDDPQRTLSCFACHTMHKPPDDPRPVAEWADTHQVAPGMDGNAACAQCHPAVADDAAAHTRHAPDSAGGTCYNCHMPYTSYGLLKAIRSHTVSSPSVAETVAAGRPNACNLCHLDRTLAWTGAALEAWYDLPTPRLTEDERTVAAGLLWAMRGDAGERALTAWALGWAPAQAASGTSWMVPHLAELLNDPYEAVRYIAYRSLRTLPGYAGVDYDYVASREERVAAALPILRAWQNSALSRRRREPELLVDAGRPYADRRVPAHPAPARQPAAVPEGVVPADGRHPLGYARRHLRFGWWSLLVFLTLGFVLELLHGFKVGMYLDASNETRRLMWRLAHAHGGLLGLIHVAFGLCLRVAPELASRRLPATSACLVGASFLLPGGFFLGGVAFYGGDPGLGILVVPGRRGTARHGDLRYRARLRGRRGCGPDARRPGRRRQAPAVASFRRGCAPNPRRPLAGTPQPRAAPAEARCARLGVAAEPGQRSCGTKMSRAGISTAGSVAASSTASRAMMPFSARIQATRP